MIAPLVAHPRNFITQRCEVCPEDSDDLAIDGDIAARVLAFRGQYRRFTIHQPDCLAHADDWIMAIEYNVLQTQTDEFSLAHARDDRQKVQWI